MRSLAIVGLLMCFSGCGNDNGGGGIDMAVAGDLSASQDDLAGGGGTGGTGGGGGDGGGIVIVDGGGTGDTCTTACDCMPGLGCFMGTCRDTAQPVYCCGSTSCVNGDLCQSSTGTYGRCGGVGTPDLAGFDVCPFIRCNSANGTQLCMNAGCNMCVSGTNGMVCSK
jgi:hypothetical protein